MNNRFSEIFIRRPVATTLLTIGIAFAGLLAFGRLPVSSLPQVDFATISVSANMPGANPDTMASAVAAPLERHLAQIADVSEMRLKQIQHFFEHYKDLESGKWVKVIGWAGLDVAHAEITDSIRRYQDR